VGRPIPLWFFLLCLLVWLLFTMAFGWAVKSTYGDDDRSGMLGRVAIRIANFTGLVEQVVVELVSYASGDYRDEQIRVTRDKNTDYSGFVPVPTAPGIKVDGLLMRADRPKMTDGWRLIAGAFTIDGEMENAALLMSPDLKIVRKWTLDEVPVDGKTPRPKYRKFVHGLDVLKDGSLVFTFDGSISLQRINACGDRLWSTGGTFNHAVTLDEAGDTVWTLSSGDTIAQVAVKDGTVLRKISMDDVIAKNPMIDILEIRRKHALHLGQNNRNTTGKWMDDPIHLNDVDPLPSAIADKFEGFEAGDLLVSARSLNLIFVLDPDTLKVKWWRIGQTQRQHDPDWLPSGEISALDNRMSRDFSEIVALDPATMKERTLFDGRKNDFYTRIRGKHQVLADGALEITSPQQGRAFEVDGDGDVVFEIADTKPGSETTNYTISEMKWLPRDYFDIGSWKCPTSG
jgi:hypothetical protein